MIRFVGLQRSWWAVVLFHQGGICVGEIAVQAERAGPLLFIVGSVKGTELLVRAACDVRVAGGCGFLVPVPGLAEVAYLRFQGTEVHHRLRRCVRVSRLDSLLV